ncbi:hypothetical protein A0H81_11798 [Grifola frondosa]|uniref:DUF6534 domain-containing protein n=1 Tax=Grifola frondosa TaxID=5627 RepID=A0A1C7LUH4_GRIFR|nr:hypothetical protein A0H81_11798 [Grifola frondosa]
MSVPIEKILGPVVIGVTLNAFLYGFCVLQFIQYRASYLRDNVLTQLLVTWTFMIDTAHTGATIYMLWTYAVDNFQNANVLTTAPWPFTATPIFIVCTSGPIQHFFAWRVKKLSGSWTLFWGLSVLSLSSTALGLANAVSGFSNPNVKDFRRLLPLVIAWLTLSMVCDLAIAVALLYFLNKNRSGFRRSDSIMNRFVHSFIESSAFNTFFTLADIVIFSSLPNTNYHLLLALPMGRVYTSTLLAMLNSRLRYKEKVAEGTASIHSLHGSRVDRRFNLTNSVKPSEVNVKVSIEQQVELDYIAEGSGSSIKGGIVGGDSDQSIHRSDSKTRTVIA